MADGVSDGRDFDLVLADEVSRWGVSTAEGVHYEFLCRHVGVGFEQCAKRFNNDGSVTASICPPDAWARFPASFEPIITASKFADARRYIFRWVRVTAKSPEAVPNGGSCQRD